ncbi:unnamed protein product [Meloidogyne enterolobii]|uniref:Uncharacterized protein n=2 Tax=Meloidogyne enterolobii TaxID=390850 RepID=A0ACB0Y3G4_MELEN|nr:unnamed protein product [Meloidogyne enterolobii]
MNRQDLIKNSNSNSNSTIQRGVQYIQYMKLNENSYNFSGFFCFVIFVLSLVIFYLCTYPVLSIRCFYE